MSSIEPDVALPTGLARKGSERKRALSFGLVIFAVTGPLGAWQLHRGHGTRGWIFIAVGAGVLSYSVVHPAGALVIRRFWLGIGGLLGRVNGVILLSVAYIVILTPLSFVARAFGRRSFKPAKDAYFTVRTVQRDAKHFEHPY